MQKIFLSAGGLALFFLAAVEISRGKAEGDSAVINFENLAFGSDGVLYATGGENGRIVAITGFEGASKAKTKVADVNLELGEKLIEALGITPDDERKARADFEQRRKQLEQTLRSFGQSEEQIKAQLAILGAPSAIQIRGLAAHPSGAVYFSAAKFAGKPEASRLFRINNKGQFEKVDFKDSRLKIASTPVPENRQPLALAVTPQGLLVSSTARSGTFRSQLHTFALPLKENASPVTAGTNLFHTTHNKWETQAPANAMTTYFSEGKDCQVIVSTMCTPVACFPAAKAVEKGSEVKMETIGEMAGANSAQCLVAYAKGRTDTVLVVSPMATHKMVGALRGKERKVNEKLNEGNAGPPVTRSAGRIESLAGWSGILRAAVFDESRLVLIREGQGGKGLELKTVPLP